MKKILIFSILLLSIFLNSSINVSAKSVEYSEVKVFFTEISKSKDEWAGAILAKGQKLRNSDEEVIGQIFRVYRDDTQAGYIIYLDVAGIVEARFQGEDDGAKDSGKIYYVFPGKFYGKEQIQELKSSAKFDNKRSSGIGEFYTVVNYDSNSDPYVLSSDTYNFTYTISTSTVPDLDHNVLLESSTMHYEYSIKDVPDYLNEYVPGGCAPTATSMLVAYYDNEIYNDISIHEGEDYWSWFKWHRFYFPMSAEGTTSGTGYSNEAVGLLLTDLALSMNTCKPDGECFTADPEWQVGFTNYLATHNHGEYMAVLSPINDVYYVGGVRFLDTSTPSELSDYQALIRTGNPAVLMIGEPQYGEGHAILGIGYYGYSGGGGVVVLDDLTHGEYWISTTYVEYFGFIYNP